MLESIKGAFWYEPNFKEEISKGTEFEIRQIIKDKNLYIYCKIDLICASLLGMILLILKHKTPEPSQKHHRDQIAKNGTP